MEKYIGIVTHVISRFLPMESSTGVIAPKGYPFPHGLEPRGPLLRPPRPTAGCEQCVLDNHVRVWESRNHQPLERRSLGFLGQGLEPGRNTVFPPVESRTCGKGYTGPPAAFRTPGDAFPPWDCAHPRGPSARKLRAGRAAVSVGGHRPPRTGWRICRGEKSLLLTSLEAESLRKAGHQGQILVSGGRFLVSSPHGRERGRAGREKQTDRQT